MTKHARMATIFPLPLTAGQQPGLPISGINNASGVSVATLSGDDHEERAVAIARAVNNHDALVKALTDNLHNLARYAGFEDTAEARKSAWWSNAYATSLALLDKLAEGY